MAKGLPTPNYTQVPNVLLDELMSEMKESELRVVLVAVRKIIGWHKTAPEPISVSQFMKLTGLSRQPVLNGIQAAIERGLLTVAGQGKRGVSLYTLNVTELVYLVDQSTNQTGLPSRPEPVYLVDQSIPATGLPSRHTKERDSKKEEKEKQRRSLFGAVARFVFSITGKIDTTFSGRIGKLTKRIMALDENATPEGIEEFAYWYTRDYPGMSMPRTPDKFAEYYMEWLGTRTVANTNSHTPPPPPVPDTEETAELTPEELAQARELFRGIAVKLGGTE